MQVAVDDLDNDQNLDIIGISGGSDGLLAWFGDGTGGFSEAVILENDQRDGGTGNRHIELLDVNNDSIDDIVATQVVFIEDLGVTAPALVYYINNGDRTFDSGIAITDITNSVRSFATIDVNNDGFRDILYNRNSSELEFVENLGNGSFANPITLMSGFGSGIVTVDFNNDDLEDIIRVFGSIRIFINDGDGSFTENSPENPSGFNALQAFPVDIDGNNTTDLLVPGLGNTGTGGVAWYSNDGEGNLSFVEIISSLENTTYSEGIAEDFNLDGDIDFVIGLFSDSNIQMWVNDGNENFGEPVLIENSNQNTVSMGVGDFNNNGGIDFVIGSFDGLSWFANDVTLSNDNFQLENLTIFPNPSDGIFKINTNNENISIIISNYLGHTIIQTVQKEIDISKLPSGLYFARIQNKNGEQVTKKIIKR